jgi:dipeptidase E
MGCHVEMLYLAHTCTAGTTATSRNDLDDDEHDLTEHARKVLDGADVVVVGGGNTLYAIDRWKSLGVDKLLEQAMDRGVVLTGGSAGAICWFDAGHSDSCDPSSFYTSMMRNFGPKATTTTTDGTGPADDDESLPPPDESELGGDGDDDLNNKGKDWKYIRVPCLGFLPGLCCPHHDRVQSNGVLRADDFDEMLLTRHSGELGIAIDHWAALVVDGGDDSYRVVSLDGKKGSVIYQNDEKVGDSGNETSTSVASFSRDANGVPGVWLKEVQDGKVVQRILPPSGKLSNVLRRALYISRSDDDAIEECRRMNVPTMDA